MAAISFPRVLCFLCSVIGLHDPITHYLDRAKDCASTCLESNKNSPCSTARGLFNRRCLRLSSKLGLSVVWIFVVLIGAWIDRVRVDKLGERNTYFKRRYYDVMLINKGINISGPTVPISADDLVGGTMSFVLIFNTFASTAASCLLIFFSFKIDYDATCKKTVAPETDLKHHDSIILRYTRSMRKAQRTIITGFCMGFTAAVAFSSYETFYFFEEKWEPFFLFAFWIHAPLCSLCFGCALAWKYSTMAAEYGITTAASLKFTAYYEHVNRKVVHLQNRFGGIVFVLVIYESSIIVTQLHSMIGLLHSPNNPSRKTFLIVEFLLIPTLVMALLMVEIGGAHLKHEAQKCAYHIKYLSSQGIQQISVGSDDWNFSARRILNVGEEIKLRLVLLEKPELSVLGFFDIGMGSLGGVLMSIATYVIILSQFQYSEHRPQF